MNIPTDTERTNTPLIIAKEGEGFRVCSPLTPGNQFVVSGLPNDPQCTCPDFTHPNRPPDWRCEHIEEVLKRATASPVSNGANHPAGSAGEPPKPGARKTSGARNPNGATMLLKRSVSPDGRIDSLSVEFSCPVEAITATEIKQSAVTIINLQSEIVAGFLKEKGNGTGNPKANGHQDPAAVAGQLLGVASMNSRWGRRLFINVLVNGQVLKLFGSEKQLADAIVAAGYPAVAERLADGYTLNLPCRVVTKPSPDGKYVNVERVYPATNGKG